MDTPKKNGSKKLENEPREDPTRNDFNEEQMSTDPKGAPVETEPVKPRGDRQPAHIPGVASS